MSAGPTYAEAQPVFGTTHGVGRELEEAALDAGFWRYVTEPDGRIWLVTLGPRGVLASEAPPGLAQPPASGMNRSVLDRYTPVTLAAVHRIHPPTETGGFSVEVDGVKHGFRLSKKELISLRDDLSLFLEAHDRLVQAASEDDGKGSPVNSASSTALSTKDGRRIDPARASIASPGRFVHDPWWEPARTVHGGGR